MQALLLCAGLGTRLKPLTHYFPKCLTPIQGRPLLGIWLEMLVQAGFKKIFINLHYMPELVRGFVDETPYVDYVEWLFEPKLLGTAGTLIYCQEKFSDSPLLLVHADNVSQFYLPSMWQSHLDAQVSVDITMMTFTTDDPSSCGIVEQDDKGNVIAFYEKCTNPPGNFANAAVYILNKKLINNLEKSITDFSTEVIEKNLHKIQIWHNECCHRDIGVFDSLLKAPWDLVDRLTSPVTQYWYLYWSKNNWQKLYKVAYELSLELALPLIVLNEIPSKPLSALIVIEQFNKEQWLKCVPFLDLKKSIIIIGKGCSGTIEEVMKKNFFRYILFVADSL